MIWSRDLSELKCPSCAAIGTLRYAPEGRTTSRFGDALRYRCESTTPKVCGFEGHDDEPALVGAVERLRLERARQERLAKLAD